MLLFSLSRVFSHNTQDFRPKDTARIKPHQVCGGLACATLACLRAASVPARRLLPLSGIWWSTNDKLN